MGLQVVMGAMMQCSFGAAPASLVVLDFAPLGALTPMPSIPATTAPSGSPTVLISNFPALNDSEQIP